MATDQPPTFTDAFAYEHADIPPGVTIDQYRGERAAAVREARRTQRAARRRRIARLLATPLQHVRTGRIAGVRL